MKTLSATLLDEIVRRIVTALQPETIYLYGSHAYGQPHDNRPVMVCLTSRQYNFVGIW